MDRRTLLALAPLVPIFAKGALAENAELAQAPAAPDPGAKPLLFADDAQFWFETQRAFGTAEYGGSLFGEVLAASSRIKAGDYDSWYDAWNEFADRSKLIVLTPSYKTSFDISRGSAFPGPQMRGISTARTTNHS
jgi:hypothetical protein